MSYDLPYDFTAEDAAYFGDLSDWNVPNWNTDYSDLSWIDLDGLGSDFLNNFDGSGSTTFDPNSSIDLNNFYGMNAESNASLIKTITSLLGGSQSGNQTVDEIAGLLGAVGGLGLTGYGLYNQYENNDANRDALAAQTAIAKDVLELNKTKDQNSWINDLYNLYGGATDKQSDLTDSMLKTDIMRDYITNRNVKQDWLAQKMVADGGLNSAGGLAQIQASQNNLFGNLDAAKNSYSDYRDDYANLRNTLGGLSYGQTTNPLTSLTNQAQYQIPTNLTDGGLNVYPSTLPFNF